MSPPKATVPSKAVLSETVLSRANPWNEAEEDLKGLLQPPPGEVARLAREVLAASPASEARRTKEPWAWAAAASVVVLLVLLGSTALYRQPLAQAPAEGQAAPSASPYQLVNSGGVVAVTNRSGQIQAIVAGGES